MEKQKRLIQLLTEKTEKGEINWSGGPTDNSYIYSMRESGIQIRMVHLDFFIDMINARGELADSFNDVELSNNRSEADWTESWFGALQSLYNLARRSAQGSDKVLNEILAELER